MKRQSLMHQYGFTMVEIMLVIAIIGIFFAATNSFTYLPQTDTEKVNRMKYAVSDKLRDETLKISIGRMPINNGVVSEKTTMNIDKVTGIITSYSWGGVVFSTWYFQPPYYDGDALYSLTGVEWWTGTTSSTVTWTWAGKIEITQNGIIFTGNTNITSENIILSILVGYRNNTRQILFDRRTGKITMDS